MIVACPNCSTRFNLPEEQSRPGAKLRCSVCKHVFTLPEPDENTLDIRAITEDDDDALNLNFDAVGEKISPRKGKKRKFAATVFASVLVLCVLGVGGLWFFAPEMLHTYFPALNPAPVATVPAEDLISRIALSDVRQYPVNNEKTGPITVIEGKTVNGFGDPRELIRVEAALYDKDGRVLISKQQLAGNAVSLFQLQVLGEQELEQALANKLGVLTYNTNVPPGGEVPFMIVFYKPPENAAEFGVKVVDARVPPAN